MMHTAASLQLYSGKTGAQMKHFHFVGAHGSPGCFLWRVYDGTKLLQMDASPSQSQFGFEVDENSLQPGNACGAFPATPTSLPVLRKVLVMLESSFFFLYSCLL